MAHTHLLRRNSLIRRETYVAVVELPDEISAFQAYRLLHYHGVSPEHLALVGAGYSSPDRIGLLRRRQIALRKATTLGLIGAGLGLVVASLMLLSAQVEPGKPLIELTEVWVIPVFSMVSAICGIVVGIFSGLMGEGTAATIYGHRLRRGRYLLMIEGSEKLVRWSQEVLNQYSTTLLY